jgi:acyl-CoA oxidase
MLSRYQSVTPQGKFKPSRAKEANQQLGYLTMMSARAGMVKMAGSMLARAVTVATRYSCVRVQGFQDTGKCYTNPT